MRGFEQTNGPAAIAALPFVDEHTVEVWAAVGETWAALLVAAERSFADGATARAAGVLGCEDTEAAGPRPLAAGSAVPGFHVVVVRAPGAAAPPAAVAPGSATVPDAAAELALAGAHRFSRYALIFRIDSLGPRRSRLRAETRAEFPGLKGGAYRALVIGTRGHVLVTRRLLGAVKRRAERAAAAGAAA